MSFLSVSWSRKSGKTPSSESRVFTDFVQSTLTASPSNEKKFSDLWKDLGVALKGELKRRGLWETPPSYLGVFGWTSWEPVGGPWGEKNGALDELLAECYSYIFVDRLRSLQAQLKVKSNIDGIVTLNIRHFLHERQKGNDPIGSQVFEILRSAVRMAVDQGELLVAKGDDRVRNDTVLAFRQGVEPVTADREKLPALVALWNHDLLPDLVTLRGRRQDEVVLRLRERLPELRAEGLEAFRFKDLVDFLKADVRARWAALLDQSQGDQVPQSAGEGRGESVRLVRPDTGVEERQVFRKLIDCVLTGIREWDAGVKTLGYLETLWQYLRVQTSDGIEATPGSLDAVLSEEMTDELPSHRKLAEQLRIPRERLAGLFEILRELLAECQSAISGKIAVSPLEGESARRDRRHRPDDH